MLCFHLWDLISRTFCVTEGPNLERIFDQPETNNVRAGLSIGEKMGKLFRLGQVLAIVLAATALGLTGSAQVASAAPEGQIVATYNGSTLNLSQGWGSATVCDVTTGGAFCFSTHAEYQTWLTGTVGEALVHPLTSCSSGLDLYENEGYGGDELILSSTLIWINLSAYSFADEVSSYRVGDCSIIMTDGTNGSGDVYPGATSAGSDVSWIGTAWNDRIQSVYIN